MFSSKELDTLMAQIISQLDFETEDIKNILSPGGNTGSGSNQGKQKAKPHISPPKILVILGLLGGVLEVKSIQINRDQIVAILLEGSLKRKRETPLDKCLDEVGAMPFDDVLKAIMGRL